MTLRTCDFFRASGVGNAVVATATNNVCGHHSKVASNIPGATHMRLGNTQGECDGAPWLPYKREVDWLLRTGDGTRTIYAEFQIDGESNVSHSEIVLRPFSHCFMTGPEGWASYDYAYGENNTFYPLTWHPDGGPDDFPHISIDDSRFNIDTPETPDCCFMFVRRIPWVTRETSSQRNYGTKATFWLKGDNLDLKGGNLRYGVSTNNGFWNSPNALSWSNEEWTYNEVPIPLSNVSPPLDWQKTFWPEGHETTLPDWNEITSEQIKSIGFSSEPTGRLKMALWLPKNL